MGNKLSLPDNVSLKETTAIVTGGNRGIGYEITFALASMGATVILACRSPEGAEKAMESMRLKHKSLIQNREEVEELKLMFMPLDLSSLRSVDKFIDDVKSQEKSIQLLICNAGIGNAAQGYTEDGYENHFQINYLSHCLIILELLPLMNKSGDDIRIVQVSSSAHKFGKLDLNNIQGDKSYSRLQMYGNSKLFQIMFMFILQKKMEGTNIAILSVHPGIVDTDINRNYQDSAFWRNAGSLMKKCGMTVNCEEGAKSSIIAAVSPSYKGCGAFYISDCKPTTSSKFSRNPVQQEKLWSYTINLLREYLSEDVLKMIEEN